MEKDNSGKPKPVILTCAQPTGKLTIGNFLGAIRNWSEMLEQQECYFGIVDLHAITTPSEPAILRQNVFECVAQYIACGLDPAKCHQFVQSHVIGHTELAWILTCITPSGELQRMTQFKDKAAKLGFKTSEQKDGEDIKFEHQGARAQASINAGLLATLSLWPQIYCSTMQIWFPLVQINVSTWNSAVILLRNSIINSLSLL